MRLPTTTFSTAWAAKLLFLHVLEGGRYRTQAHTFGAHQFYTPSNAPNLPEIMGPFEVSVSSLFLESPPVQTDAGLFCTQTQTIHSSTIFAYSSPFVKFGQDGSTLDMVLIVDNGSSGAAELRLSNAIVWGEMTHWRVGVDATGLAFIEKNGGEMYSSTTNVNLIPTNVNRSVKELGIATIDESYSGIGCVLTGVLNIILFPFALLLGDIFGTGDNIVRLPGLVNGFSMKTTGQTLSDQLRHANLPGQLFGSGFVVSFWGRMDNTSNRQDQQFFAFENSGNDGISCGQSGSSKTVVCRSYQQGQVFSVATSASVIDDGVWAFWHFGIENDGRMYIEKNGSEVGSNAAGVVAIPRKLEATLFRHLEYTNSFSNHELFGSVIGIRIDPDTTS